MRWLGCAGKDALVRMRFLSLNRVFTILLSIQPSYLPRFTEIYSLPKTLRKLTEDLMFDIHPS